MLYGSEGKTTTLVPEGFPMNYMTTKLVSQFLGYKKIFQNNKLTTAKQPLKSRMVIFF